jgi:hypothetical protein
MISRSPASLGASLLLRKSVNRYATEISPSIVCAQVEVRQRGDHVSVPLSERAATPARGG